MGACLPWQHATLQYNIITLVVLKNYHSVDKQAVNSKLHTALYPRHHMFLTHLHTFCITTQTLHMQSMADGIWNGICVVHILYSWLSKSKGPIFSNWSRHPRALVAMKLA